MKIGDLGLATMLRARTAPQSVLGEPLTQQCEPWAEAHQLLAELLTLLSKADADSCQNSGSSTRQLQLLDPMLLTPPQHQSHCNRAM